MIGDSRPPPVDRYSYVVRSPGDLKCLDYLERFGRHDVRAARCVVCDPGLASVRRERQMMGLTSERKSLHELSVVVEDVQSAAPIRYPSPPVGFEEEVVRTFARGQVTEHLPTLQIDDSDLIGVVERRPRKVVSDGDVVRVRPKRDVAHTLTGRR